MIVKPDMPEVAAKSIKLEEVEVTTDAYKAQLVQQKAKRVEAAEALVSKASQDPKVVKKTQTKNARGRGRGRGRGKAAIKQDQEPSATTADDEQIDDVGDEQVDERQGEGDEEHPVPGNNEGGEVEGKKKYKRKTLTKDELDAMWKDRVSRYNCSMSYMYTYMHVQDAGKSLQQIALKIKAQINK